MRARPFRWLARSLIVALLAGVPASAQSPRFFTIGTGSVSGVYYSVGEAMCLLINRDRSRHGLRCSVEATPAAIHNLRALRRNDLPFALTQADAEFAAVNGLEEFAGTGPDRKLRVVAGLHLELMTIAVRKGSGIASIDDLRGRQVSLGADTSGTRFSVSKLMQALDLRATDFTRIASLKADEHGDALCRGRIDAFAFLVGHPSQNIADTSNACPIALLPIDGKRLASLLRAPTTYVAGHIPGGEYRGVPGPVNTYGARALLMTHAEVPEALVYEVTRAIFDHLEDFKARHGALADLDPSRMANPVTAAPLHPGALRYYQERRLR